MRIWQGTDRTSSMIKGVNICPVERRSGSCNAPIHCIGEIGDDVFERIGKVLVQWISIIHRDYLGIRGL